MRLSVSIVSLFLIVISSYSQPISVVVKDSATGAPLKGALVVLKDVVKKNLVFETTGADGIAIFKNTLPNVVNISVEGYKIVFDTLRTIETTFLLSPNFYKFGEVVVTGQAKPVAIDQSIYNIKLIGRDEMQSRPATNLSELLASETNLNISQNGALGSSLSLQGLSGDMVKILIDGVPLVGRENRNVDLSKINIQNVDHIEIVEGPMSVVYGTDALAGTINIITREQLSREANCTANVYSELNRNYNIDLSGGWQNGKHIISSDIARHFFEGFRTGNQQRKFMWYPHVDYTGSIKYIYKNKKSYFKIQTNLLNQEMRNTGENPIYYPYVKDDRYITQRMVNTSEWRKTFSENFNLQTIASYQHYSRNSEIWSNNLVELNTKLIESSQTLFDVVTLRSVIENQLNKKVLIQSGIDYTNETANGERIGGYKKMSDVAAFLNTKYSNNKVFEIQPGVRLSMNSKYKSPVIYSVSLKYAPELPVNARFSIARGYRSPTLKELYLEFKDGSHNITGNDSLKPEYSYNYNLSGSWSPNVHGNISIRIKNNYFFNTIQNKIDYLYSSERPTDAKLINIKTDNYKTLGQNFSAEFSFYNKVTIGGGWSLLGLSKPMSVNDFSFSHNLTGSLIYRTLNRNVSLSLLYKYNGPNIRYFSKVEKNVTYITEGRVDRFHNLDFVVNRSYFNRSIEIKAGVKNIFDNVSVLSTGQSDPHGNSGEGAMVGWGRTVFLSMQYNLGKNIEK